MKRLLISFFLSLFLSLFATAHAADTTRATYDLYYRGAKSGTVSVTLTRETIHTYYRAIAEPSWLARLLGKGVITERGTMTSADLRPQEYFYHDAGEGHHYKYTYDWPNNKVVVTTHEDEFTQPLGENTLDPVAMAVRLIRDLPDLLPNYSVLSKGDLKVYRFDTPKPEPLEASDREQLFWKVVRVRGSADNSRIITWHDPTRDQWMIRTVRTENGEEKIRLELTDLDRSSASDLHPVDQ